jgi:hypothetical protein
MTSSTTPTHSPSPAETSGPRRRVIRMLGGMNWESTAQYYP